MSAPSPAAAQVTYMGIPRESFDYSYSEQKSSQWCWAAAIQMVLQYYGVSVSQEEIVRRSYGSDPFGNLPNWPGSFEVITANLNNWTVDDDGTAYIVRAQMGLGPPPPSVLLNEVGAQRPVILAYMTSSNSGHAVVATAASYTSSAYGPIVQSIIVRDPWPNQQNMLANGRVEYPGSLLANRMTAYWIVRVAR